MKETGGRHLKLWNSRFRAPLSRCLVVAISSAARVARKSSCRGSICYYAVVNIGSGEGEEAEEIR
jgi:hypothetical protein